MPASLRFPNIRFFLHSMSKPTTRYKSSAHLSEAKRNIPLNPAQAPNASPSLVDPGGRRLDVIIIAVFSVTMFISAALLFLVEPMFAKMALPLLGGSAAVWTTCLVFFQMTLLAGYVYAHASAKLLGRAAQFFVHGALLLAACLMLPIRVPAGWTPPPQPNPVWWLLHLLLVAVGLPFFVLGATTPTLQDWIARSPLPASRDPYFLYAASNSGSLLGLLSYPFVLEPLLRLGDQSRLWMWSYGLFGFMMAGCILLMWRSPLNGSSRVKPTYAGTGDLRDLSAERPLWRVRLRWMALAFVPSSLMLGVTTALTTDVPAIPLLWVLPLALYLLSFVLVFKRRPFPHLWLSRRMPFLILGATLPIVMKGVLPLMVLLPLDLLTLFAVAVYCHGEVARTRPAPQYLTEFYLWVSVGGMLGGVFNALLAPVIFSTVLEFPLALVIAALLRSPASGSEDTPRDRWLDYLAPVALGVAVAVGIEELQAGGVAPGRVFNFIVFGPAALCCLRFGTRPRRFGLGIAALVLASQAYAGAFGHILHRERSFFGVYRISDDTQYPYRVLFHGGTAHGMQSLDPRRACEPLAYFTRSGPLGQVFAAFQGRPADKEVAVIGLGAGVIACYERPHERFTFYEIDPTVLRIAQDRHYFTYLSDCGAASQVVLGDARLSLRNAPPHVYGMIVVDAFSGDSIPVHLLTREAMALYLAKLTPDGLLAIHISNRYLDLEGVLGELAHDAGLSCLKNDDALLSEEDRREGKFASWWMVIARHPADLEELAGQPGWKPPRLVAGSRVWTDDYSNIVSILRFR